MSQWNKWIAGALGWAMGGPIGGIIGFALGAVVAAEWLRGKRGFYTIDDMMKDLI